MARFHSLSLAHGMRNSVHRELGLLALSVAVALVLMRAGTLMGGGIVEMSVRFVLLFPLMLRASMGILHHGGALAEVMRKPYGMLLLTFAVDFIEVVSIAAVILHGENNPTLLRDSLLSVIMIVLNLVVGLTLLVGAWRHREQQYNLQSANSYLTLLLPLAVLTLVLPGTTDPADGAALSAGQTIFLSLMATCLYGVFLMLQTGRHRTYFVAEEDAPGDAPLPRRPSTRVHGGLLVANLAVATLLAVQIAIPIDYYMERVDAPLALGGIVMALLVVTPEAVEALRAARANRLQQAINVLLGSVLATIGLTVPAILLVGALAGRSMELGLHGTSLVMLLLTLAVSVVTFASGRTTVLQGAVHLLLFAAYLVLVFQP